MPTAAIGSRRSKNYDDSEEKNGVAGSLNGYGYYACVGGDDAGGSGDDDDDGAKTAKNLLA